MTIAVHHQPLNADLSWSLHAWQLAWDGNSIWDPTGRRASGGLVDFAFPDVDDPRKVRFKFRSGSSKDKPTWEPEEYARQFSQIPTGDVWTFEQSRRVLYRDPAAGAPVFRAGDVVTFTVLTRARFRGGQLYAWNPYRSAVPAAYFDESSRDDGAGRSTFEVTLTDWMTAGFHFKLAGPGGNGREWEPNSSNRVWRPSDGGSVWLKSGQCDVRNTPLGLTPTTVEVLFPATLSAPPSLTVHDVVEDLQIPVQAAAVSISSVSPLFKVASYAPAIYPEAAYQLRATTGEQSPISRPFPAAPGVPAATSRFVLGAGGWLDAFPAPVASDLTIQPATPSSFGAALSVQVATGNAPPYQTAAASLQGDGTWKASLTLAPNTTSCLRLLPGAGPEPTLYDWIDTGRYFTPAAGMTAFFTAEEVYGVSTQGPTPFADPPSRSALMTAAFGAAMTGSGVFATREMPQGATLVDDKVYFVVHAPHAAYARLVFCGLPDAGGKYTRQLYAMSLTQDRFYWWCAIPATVAKPGSLYRLLLNDDLEVLDPAAREVLDRGSFDVDVNADPNDPSTAWSLVLNVDDVRATAHAQPWQTMGWQNLLIYEMHTECFTNLNPGTRVPFDLLVDELQLVSRLGQPGYLRSLPVTAFELLPVHEFNYAVDWGYDPSFYFAVDGHYGGSAGLARFVNAAHANGRAVLLDVVYNHSLGSPLMKIAPDVYTNGPYDGDRMNCGHPMVLEHFRQATLHLMHTFGVDGFRFDDTKTIETECEYGPQSLQAIHAAIRTAGAAETGRWPYCVAENSSPEWAISDPAAGAMDGQWGITESYGILDASYDSGDGSDHSGELAQDMNAPSYWGRPFYQAVRFGESHDIVSTQGQGQTRIAARPPFGQGLQVAKALGALTLLTNGIPMLFMGQEYGETTPFIFFQNNSGTPPALNPQSHAGPAAGYNGSVLAWFRQVMGLRNDSSQGLQGDANYQVVATANRTVAFTCGVNQCLFAVVTFGTPNNRQDSGWLGLPAGSAYKEIFNSSWPAFAVESEMEQTNGGYDARITSGQILNLPFAGAVVLQRA